ncbi:Copper metallochaperone, bacterial analog of Cox17 protein [hydrothermal vent metagenome]|uniref:Copper metallochaperone, bacterial analog of Cox17 protein n=1 Tax=hydrothermal vent metagenome TaxID=652676 RepID=A0A3B0RZ20_9ZZZZ
MKNRLSGLTFCLALGTAIIFTLPFNVIPGMAQTIADLSVSKNWIRATPPAAMVGGGYLVISNSGSHDDTLTAAEFTGAKKTEIHEMKIKDGVMKMRPLKDGIKIPAGGTIVLKPGGFHLMFMGLKSRLKDGQNFPIKLTFANAGETIVNFPVLTMEKGKKLMMPEN